jgi:cytochrome c553
MSALRHLLAASIVALIAVPSHAESGDPEVGHKKSEACKACHGDAGISVSPEFPNLAGQHQDYLVAALRHYKEGKRKNPIMQAQVANLSHRDILDLTAYYSRLSGLETKK